MKIGPSVPTVSELGYFYMTVGPLILYPLLSIKSYGLA